MLRTELYTLNCVWELANIVSPKLLPWDKAQLSSLGPIFIGDKQ